MRAVISQFCWHRVLRGEICVMSGEGGGAIGVESTKVGQRTSVLLSEL